MKQKTHKASAKRVKMTTTGKLLRKKAAVSHLLSHKSERPKMAISINKSDIRKVKKLLPNLK